LAKGTSFSLQDYLLGLQAIHFGYRNMTFDYRGIEIDYRHAKTAGGLITAGLF
jgi:hypothetical protein